MARELNVTYKDTTVTGKGETISIAIPALNWGADFRVTVDEPDEVNLKNVTTPLGLDETFRFGNNPIKNVYNGSDIEPATRSQFIVGNKILVAHREKWIVTDSAEPTYQVILPFKSTLTFDVPRDPIVSVDDVEAAVYRTIAGLFDVTETGNTRLRDIILGVLKPTSL